MAAKWLLPATIALFLCMPSSSLVAQRPTYDRHLGEDSASFKGLDERVRIHEQRERDNIIQVETRINRNGERLSALEERTTITSSRMERLEERLFTIGIGVFLAFVSSVIGNVLIFRTHRTIEQHHKNGEQREE